MIDAIHLLPNQPALLFAGYARVNGGAGATFGDGLRCAGQGVTRLGVRIPSATGNAQWGPGLSSHPITATWPPPPFVPVDFQCWYRDPVGSPCGTGFNLSNGLEVVFTLP